MPKASAIFSLVWSVSYMEKSMRIVKLFGLPPIESTNNDNCGPEVVNSCMEGTILACAQGLKVMNVNSYTFYRK